MNIAIDGRVLGQFSAGKTVYLESVLTEWAKNKEHHYHVYGYQPQNAWPANWRFTTFRSPLERIRAFRSLSEDVLFSPSSYLTSIVANRPTLTTVHDLVMYRSPVRLPLKTRLAERYLLGWAVRRSVAITVQTKSVADDLAHFFPAAQPKTHIVPPGLSRVTEKASLPDAATQERLLKRLGIHGSYVLFVGTLEPRKNIARLIAAFQQLPPALRQTHQLVLAGGSGWADSELADALRRAVAPSIIKTGRVSNDVLATLYHRSTLVCYPSLYEGVGYPVLEAYGWGKPVITSTTSSLAEIGRGTAVLVDPTDTQALTRALEGALSDPVRLAELAARSHSRAKEFSWANTAQTYLQLLSNLGGSG